MLSFSAIVPFFWKARGRYQMMLRSPTRSSSDDDRLSNDTLLEKEVQPLRQQRPFWRRYTQLIIVHAFILVTYILIVYLVAAHARTQALKESRVIYSPAHEAVSWVEHRFTSGDRIQEASVYSGKPSPELDLAWHNLLNFENIRLEPEIMRHYGREDIGVAIPEGDGYIGTLNVYHELHCIKRLHQYMYQEYYWNDITDKQRETNRVHNEHCLDFLRQSSMCHGDIGLITYEWRADARLPVANATTHQCVDWDRLDRWTRDRSVDMLQPGWLVHPTFGLAYPEGEGDRIGAAGVDVHLAHVGN